LACSLYVDCNEWDAFMLLICSWTCFCDHVTERGMGFKLIWLSGRYLGGFLFTWPTNLIERGFGFLSFWLHLCKKNKIE